MKKYILKFLRVFSVYFTILTDDIGEFYYDPFFYRNLIGKLNFFTNTCLDLAFSIQTLSQFMQSPRLHHFEALQHVLHYVANTAGQGILLNGSTSMVL